MFFFFFNGIQGRAGAIKVVNQAWAQKKLSNQPEGTQWYGIGLEASS